MHDRGGDSSSFGSSYERRLARLPEAVRDAVRFQPARFLPLHPGGGTRALEVRPAAEVACRAVALGGFVAAALDPGSRRSVIAWLEREGLREKSSPVEQGFLRAVRPEKTDLVRFTRHVERLWALGWALRRIEDLGAPLGPCDHDIALGLVPGVGDSTAAFLRGARVRSADEVTDELSILQQIRSRWNSADVEARGTRIEAGEITIVRIDAARPRPDLAGIDDEVAREWHLALNWLVRYMNEPWDEISADT
jgi:hypothetical protein